MKLKSFISKIEIFYEKYLSRIEKGYLLKFDFIYRNYLRLVRGFRFFPKNPEKIPWMNNTLKNREEVNLAIKIIKASNLNLHNVPEKNWDSLIALKIITQNTNSSAKILDAGGEKVSLILFWLYQLGFSNLKCLNLLFEKRMKRGKIEFIPGDLTKTDFPNNHFDIITCISVIEHGVDEAKYFKEMNRILKKGGLLITSTDYWESKIDTSGKFEFNNPIFIYDRDSVKRLLNIAFKSNFRLFGPEIDLNCQYKVVNWNRFNLDYTFLIFCLQKM